MKRTAIVLAVWLVVLGACSDEALDTSTTSTTIPTTTWGTVPECTQETVNFEIADLTIEATRCPGGPDWVVLAHDFRSNRQSWNEFPQALQEAGYTVLAYDNRGHGGSDCPRETGTLFEDAVAAVAYARNAGAASIVFGGAAANGGVALYMAATEDLAGVFALSAPADSPCAPDVITRMPLIDEPILLVAAEDDADAAEVAGDLHEAALDSDLVVLEVGGSGTTMLDLNADLSGRIVDWLTEQTG